VIDRLTTITELPVDDIQIAERLRDVRPEGVATLVEAIQDRGFVGRILVRRKKDGDHVIDGAHRLTAMRELGAETIPCDVVKCTDDEARMFEVDGNLAGAKMTALELAYFLAQRRRIYQRLYPETQHGGARGNQHTGGWQTDTMSVCQVISQERGISDRHVRRLMNAGDALGADEYRKLARGAQPVTLNDLGEIAKIGDASERSYVVQALADGRIKKASAARADWKAATGKAPALRSPEDIALSRLKDTWVRASHSVRARFVAEFGDQIDAARADSEADDG
jgi:ParB family chromosome partitioning protein